MKTALKIGGMTCQSCALHVENALKQVLGVTEVQVGDWRSGAAQVVADQSVSASMLTAAVTDAGYRATVSGSEEDLADGESFDLAVIGTGAGGMAAAIKAAELGKQVVIFERSTVGGTCVNVGCIPSKTLIAAAQRYYEAGHPSPGVKTSAGRLDWTGVIGHKDALVNDLRQKKYADVLGHYRPDIRLVQADVRFASDGRLQLDDGRAVAASRIVIAAGAAPRIFPLEGIEAVSVLTSRTAMSLDHKPKSLIVIGGRAIALELGQTFARFGTQVTILQRSRQILPEHETEISEALTKALVRDGIVVETGVTPVSIRTDGRQKAVETEIDGERRTFQAEEVLMAVGVSPNTGNLGLEEVGVDMDEAGFIRVDEHQRTSNPAIYAVGDATTAPKLVYVAAAAGTAASEHMFADGTRRVDLASIADVVFTDPEVARVGLSEAEALSQGHDAQTTVLAIDNVPRALVTGHTDGVIKLIKDVDTGKLLGAQVAAPQAGEIIQTAALAIRFGMTADELATTVVPYLTYTEGLKLAAQTFDKDPALLSCCAG